MILLLVIFDFHCLTVDVLSEDVFTIAWNLPLSFFCGFLLGRLICFVWKFALAHITVFAVCKLEVLNKMALIFFVFFLFFSFKFFVCHWGYWPDQGFFVWISILSVPKRTQSLLMNDFVPTPEKLFPNIMFFTPYWQKLKETLLWSVFQERV